MGTTTLHLNCPCCCACAITVAAPQGCSPITDTSGDFLVAPTDCDDQTTLPGDTGGTLRFPFNATGSSDVISIAAPQSIECGATTLYFSHWLISANCCIQNFDNFANDGGDPPGVYCHYDPVLSLRLCTAAQANEAGGCACTVTPVYGALVSGWTCGCCSCYTEGVPGTSIGGGACACDALDSADSPCLEEDPDCQAGGGSFTINIVAAFTLDSPANPNLQELLNHVSGGFAMQLDYGGASVACGDSGAVGGCVWSGEEGVAGSCTAPSPGSESCGSGTAFSAHEPDFLDNCAAIADHGVYCDEAVATGQVSYTQIIGGIEVLLCANVGGSAYRPAILRLEFSFTGGDLPSVPNLDYGSHAAKCYAYKHGLSGSYQQDSLPGPSTCVAGEIEPTTYTANVSVG